MKLRSDWKQKRCKWDAASDARLKFRDQLLLSMVNCYKSLWREIEKKLCFGAISPISVFFLRASPSSPSHFYKKNQIIYHISSIDSVNIKKNLLAVVVGCRSDRVPVYLTAYTEMSSTSTCFTAASLLLLFCRSFVRLLSKQKSSSTCILFAFDFAFNELRV